MNIAVLKYCDLKMTRPINVQLSNGLLVLDLG